MGNVIQLGTKALALLDAGDGRVAVRLARPVNQIERELEAVFSSFDAARDYADLIVDFCSDFYGPVLDMTGDAHG